MGSFIVEPQRRLEITASADVLVAGGGIAGMAAAMAAARHGKKVLLLEREYALGGMATLGLVTIYLPLDDGMGRQLIFSMGEELLRLSIEHGAEGIYPKAWLEGGSVQERTKNRYIAQFNPHLFVLRMEKLLEELGVTVLYGTLICGADVEDGRIRSVIIENKSGRSAVSAETFVDCTGDADLCALAGEDTTLYEKGNGLASWYYYTDNSGAKLKMFGLADVAQGGGPAKGDDPYTAAKVASLDRSFRFSGVDGPELSRAVLAAHGKMYEDILAKRRESPAYTPVTMSTIPLVRMSRRLVGAAELNESCDRARVADSIGMTGDWRRSGPAFEIPFGALHGVKIRNLLAAGRDISVSDPVWDVARVIPPCAVTGQAAGTAAALFTDMCAAPVGELQSALEGDGVKLHL